MKIAVTYENGLVYQHFGHTPAFKIYEIEGGKVSAIQVIGTDGNGHGALAGYLMSQGVCALICGGLGGGAKMALENAGIEVYAGVTGDTDQAVEAFLAGQLDFSTEANCSHHDHEHGDHSCGHGDHGCGHGGHGDHGDYSDHGCGRGGCHGSRS